MTDRPDPRLYVLTRMGGIAPAAGVGWLARLDAADPLRRALDPGAPEHADLLMRLPHERGCDAADAFRTDGGDLLSRLNFIVECDCHTRAVLAALAGEQP